MQKIEILYEDNDTLVINKPPGLIVHSDGRTEEPSVAEWVLKNYPAIKDVGEPWVSPQGETILRPGVVHRLDRTTSGVMVIAKNAAAYDAIKQQFQNRSLEKVYRAFAYGGFKTASGVIEKEIVRIRSTPPRWGVKRNGDDKKHRVAITEWNLLLQGVDPDTGEAAAMLELRPKTGRTHQLRVHLKAVHHPIVCDPLYAAGKPCILGFTRPALHAHKLIIDLSSGRHTFEAPLPIDFIEAEKLLS